MLFGSATRLRTVEKASLSYAVAEAHRAPVGAADGVVGEAEAPREAGPHAQLAHVLLRHVADDRVGHAEVEVHERRECLWADSAFLGAVRAVWALVVAADQQAGARDVGDPAALHGRVLRAAIDLEPDPTHAAEAAVPQHRVPRVVQPHTARNMLDWQCRVFEGVLQVGAAPDRAFACRKGPAVDAHLPHTSSARLDGANADQMPAIAVRFTEPSFASSR